MSFKFTKKQFEIYLYISKNKIENLLINDIKSFLNFYFSIKKLNQIEVKNIK